MTVLAFIFSAALMVPFFAWGIYTLRERYVLHEEIPRNVEVATLGGVVVFCIVQFNLLGKWTDGWEILYIFTVLSVLVSATALFGPMFVSVASQTVVDFVHPLTEDRSHSPHFGPAEALEESGDLEGALREYMVLARVFPKHAETSIRTGNTLAELARYEEAVAALSRGMELLDEPERALMIANRLSDIYLNELDQREEAQRILSAYVESYPDSKRLESVRRKLQRISERQVAQEELND